ncbi:hypothetical protein C8R44DRAFT_681626 [Mycena epipterygia]|nr:hypothetical protein C8R44DRAFT_681626 [Mycena epipterygia]
MANVALSYGPLLIGGTVAIMLSGIVAVQCIIFFKLYPDEAGIKIAMVATVWTLDLTQSFFIIASLFDYFIVHFGDHSALLSIPWFIAFTILFTAMQTCVVHLFYAHKIYCSSGKNWWITGPIVYLATLRLLAAIVATAEMLHLKVWAPFINDPYPRILFTVGLSLSAGTDLIITVCLCYYLRKIRRLSSSSVMKGVMDTLTLYTLDNGFITLLTTVGALSFWLVLPGSTLSLSLHFVIGKLYPNSLLVLLNTRKGLREMHSGDQGIHFDPSSDHLANYYTHFPHRAPVTLYGAKTSLAEPPAMYDYDYHPTFKMHKVEVKVERTVRRESASISDKASYNPRTTYVSVSPSQRSVRARGMHWPPLP